MKVLSLFSGIGAFEKALKNLRIPFELVGFSEIDKYAVKSYCAIHNVSESMNLGDITKIDEKALPKDIDLITYGFPCQDISLAGKQKGLLQCEECNTSNPISENYIKRMRNGEKFFCEKCGAELKQTRSGLFFEALRIIEETQPRVAIAENVKNLTGKKFKEQFQIVLDSLDEAGYNNYWQVLNAKDYGIPQNRERVFIVSIRKDIDKGEFKFPKGFPLEIKLRDIIEEDVDEKFYVNNDRVEKIVNSSFTQEKTRIQTTDICSTLLARDYKDPKCIEVYDYYNGKQINSDVCGTITTGCARTGSGTFLIGGMQKNQAVKTDGVSTCLTSSMGQGGGYVPMHNYTKDYRVRKLTPKECFRLMGFADEDFAKAEAENSNTQLYKQAGNSIVVDVITHIFANLFKEKTDSETV